MRLSTLEPIARLVCCVAPAYNHLEGSVLGVCLIGLSLTRFLTMRQFISPSSFCSSNRTPFLSGRIVSANILCVSRSFSESALVQPLVVLRALKKAEILSDFDSGTFQNQIQPRDTLVNCAKLDVISRTLARLWLSSSSSFELHQFTFPTT